METIKKVITDFMLFHYKEDNIEISKTLFEGEEINTVEDVIYKMIDIYEREGKPENLKSGDCNLAEVNASALGQMCINCINFIPIQRPENRPILKGNCLENIKEVWKDHHCDKFKHLR